MNEFYERLKTDIKKERADLVENMALGYAGNEYQKFVGMVRGFDDCLAIADKLLRDIHNGK